MVQTPPDTSLKQLILHARKGDKEAIAMLYETHVDRIYRYIAYRVSEDEAEDLTAEVFLIMVRALPKYRLTEAPFEAWLYRIATNRLGSYYRQHHRAPQTELHEDLPSATLSAEEEILDQQEIESLRAALHYLTDEQQSVMILRFVERLSHEEVAEILGKKVATVKSIQHRALKELSKRLNTTKVRHYLRGDHE